MSDYLEALGEEEDDEEDDAPPAKKAPGRSQGQGQLEEGKGKRNVGEKREGEVERNREIWSEMARNGERKNAREGEEGGREREREGEEEGEMEIEKKSRKMSRDG